jgi:hypothetical protein
MFENNALQFRYFLIEMQTTPEEKERIRTIINKLINGDNRWLEEKYILVGKKPPFWILNYSPKGRNEYNSLVRGMVVKKPDPTWDGDELSLIVSFPFMRFYNKGEKEAATVDFETAEMLEKLDGTLVGVFFPDGNPHNPQWHTRRMLSTHDTDMKMIITGFNKQSKYKFMHIIGEYVKQLQFNQTDVSMTHIFEFIHDASKVITQYTPEQYGLYLIGSRNLKTHKELTEKELDEVAKRINAKRPRRWGSISDEDKIREFMDEIHKKTKDFEGMVFRDSQGRRIKMKRSDYVQTHHLLDQLGYKNLIPIILKGETEEILAYFPSAKKAIDNFYNAYNAYIDKATEEVIKYKNMNLSRKETALEISTSKRKKDKFLSGLIISNFEKNSKEEIRASIDQSLRNLVFGFGKNKGQPKRLMEILGLMEED